jgi:antibiotic biosynthesis monooxygenase (ABM) superfamily enzyme
MGADRNREPVPDGDAVALQTPVTTVIQQRPKPEAVGRYEAWLKEIIPAAQQFCGHRGVNVIRPHGGSDAYTIVLHFDEIDNLQRWLTSDVRKRLIEKVQPFLRAEENIEIKTGFEFWFTPPAGGKHAKPYKQFLVTLSAIFPLTVIIPWLLQPVFTRLPVLALPIVSQFMVGVIIVGLMTWAVMPYYTRLISRWLYS